MRTKIEMELSDDQLREFFKRCAQTKGGTKGPGLRAIAQEFGVTLTHDSANNIRKGPLADFLDELKETRDFAENVASLAKNGVGLSDGAASAFAGKVFKAAVSIGEDEVGGKKANNLSLAIARLRAGDQRSEIIAMLQRRLELQQFDAVAAAIKHAKEIRAVIGDKKLDDGQKTERVRKILFGEKPADWTPITTTGAGADAEAGK